MVELFAIDALSLIMLAFCAGALVVIAIEAFHD